MMVMNLILTRPNLPLGALSTQQAVVLEEVGKIAIRDIEIDEPFTSRDVRIGASLLDSLE